MAIQNPTDRVPHDLPSSLANDRRPQSSVLSILLIEHPVQLTLAELARELSDDPDDFAQRDTVKQAVRDLAGIGLLYRRGIFVLPSRAALHYERLGVVA